MTIIRFKRSTSLATCALWVLGTMVACTASGPEVDDDLAPSDDEQVDQTESALDNPTGLVGKWRFNEGEGQRVLDSSGNALHGRRGSDPYEWDYNDPYWLRVDPGQGVPRDVPPYALRFWANDFVKVNSWLYRFWRLEPEKVSVETWVKASYDPGANAYVLSKGASACASASYAIYNTPGGVRFYITDMNGAYHESPPKPGAEVWNGNWHHIVGTYDGAAVSLYFDGAFVGSTAYAGAIKYDLSSHRNLYIGTYKSEACTIGFRGAIDDVRIYRKALSGAEVAQRYTGLVTPDADVDGVVDDRDKCPNTSTSQIANNKGCSVEQCCPTSAPRTPDGACPKETWETSWRNHGAYVSCVSNVAKQLLNEGKISYDQKDAMTSAAGRSNVGK